MLFWAEFNWHWVCHLIETSLWDSHWGDYFCRSSCVTLTAEMKLVNAVTLFCHHFCVLVNFWRIQNPQHEVYELLSVTSVDVLHHISLRKPLMRLQTETITRDYGLPSLSTPELRVDMSPWNSMGFFSTFTGKVTGHLVLSLQHIVFSSFSQRQPRSCHGSDTVAPP